MRDKLVKLIREVAPYWAEVLADYLLASGWICPTRCKNCEKYEPVGIRPFLGVCQEWDTVVSEAGFCHHGEPKKQEGKHEADHSH